MSSGRDRSRPAVNLDGSGNDIGLADLRQSYAGDGLQIAIDNAAGDWFQGAFLAIKQLARTARGFTVDNVIDMVGAPTDFHYSGAVFASAQRQGIVEAVGARVGRDGRLVRVWWGVRDDVLTAPTGGRGV